MEPLASPIRIPIFPSPSIAKLVYGGHVLIALTFILVFPLNAYSIAAAFGVCLSLIIQHVSRRDLAARVDAIVLRSNGQWRVVSRRGEILKARLSGTTFVSPWLVILTLKPHGQRSAHIVLGRDNTMPDSFRRLRVRLRVPMGSALS